MNFLMILLHPLLPLDFFRNLCIVSDVFTDFTESTLLTHMNIIHNLPIYDTKNPIGINNKNEKIFKSKLRENYVEKKS